MEILTIAESMGVNAQFVALIYFAWKYDKRLTKIETKLF